MSPSRSEPLCDGRFRKSILANGVTLLTEEIPSLRGLAIGFWIKAGTRHEAPSEIGLSHFLEHMLFKGTRTRSALEVAREIERVGGEFNAFTSREYTCFHVTVLDRDAGLGLEILTDVLLNSRFESAEIERERGVILQEISMIDESPEELVYDLFFEQVYGDHGLGRSILGTGKTIRSLKRAQLMRFFRKHYRPEQLIVSVAGNVSHEQVRRRLGPLARGSWPGREPLRKRPARPASPASEDEVPEFAPAPPLRTGRWWAERHTEQVHLVWGVRGPSYCDRDRVAAILLSAWLGGGMSSELFQEIREKRGLAYTVDANLFSFYDSGLFTVYAATSEAKVPLCLELIDRTLERACRRDLGAEELKIVKEGLKGSIGLASDSVESRMSAMATNEIFLGRQVSVEEIYRLVDRVAAPEIRDAAKRLLAPGPASVLALGPKPRPAVLRRAGISLT